MATTQTKTRKRPALETLADHWDSLTGMATRCAQPLGERDHMRCFIAGAMATLGLVRRALHTGRPAAFTTTLQNLQAEVDAFLAEEKAIAERTTPLAPGPVRTQ